MASSSRSTKDKRYRARLKANGRCPGCRRPVIGTKVYCPDCREKAKIRMMGHKHDWDWWEDGDYGSGWKCKVCGVMRPDKWLK